MVRSAGLILIASPVVRTPTFCKCGAANVSQIISLLSPKQPSSRCAEVCHQDETIENDLRPSRLRQRRARRIVIVRINTPLASSNPWTEPEVIEVWLPLYPVTERIPRESPCLRYAVLVAPESVQFYGDLSKWSPLHGSCTEFSYHGSSLPP